MEGRREGELQIRIGSAPGVWALRWWVSWVMRWNNGSSQSQEGGRQSLLKRSVVIDRGRESARGGEGGGLRRPQPSLSQGAVSR